MSTCPPFTRYSSLNDGNRVFEILKKAGTRFDLALDDGEPFWFDQGRSPRVFAMISKYIPDNNVADKLGRNFIQYLCSTTSD